MLEIFKENLFFVFLILLCVVIVFLRSKGKHRFRNEITGDFTSDNPVTLVNPKFVEASTRHLAEDEKRERNLVSCYGRGNASLQLGRFTTQEDKDELFERITSYRFIEEPTDQYIEDVIENIKTVLAIHKIKVGQVGYDDPWFLLSVNHAELRIRIYNDFFILNKGSQEATSRLNITEITKALKTIGVLK
jgi:hypothetical protein